MGQECPSLVGVFDVVLKNTEIGYKNSEILLTIMCLSYVCIQNVCLLQLSGCGFIRLQLGVKYIKRLTVNVSTSSQWLFLYSKLPLVSYEPLPPYLAAMVSARAGCLLQPGPSLPSPAAAMMAAQTAARCRPCSATQPEHLRGDLSRQTGSSQ